MKPDQLLFFLLLQVEEYRSSVKTNATKQTSGDVREREREREREEWKERREDREYKQIIHHSTSVL